jgi:hypothetical protein
MEGNGNAGGGLPQGDCGIGGKVPLPQGRIIPGEGGDMSSGKGKPLGLRDKVMNTFNKGKVRESVDHLPGLRDKEGGPHGLRVVSNIFIDLSFIFDKGDG